MGCSRGNLLLTPRHSFELLTPRSRPTGKSRFRFTSSFESRETAQVSPLDLERRLSLWVFMRQPPFRPPVTSLGCSLHLWGPPGNDAHLCQLSEAGEASTPSWPRTLPSDSGNGSMTLAISRSDNRPAPDKSGDRGTLENLWSGLPPKSGKPLKQPRRRPACTTRHRRDSPVCAPPACEVHHVWRQTFLGPPTHT